MRLLSTGADHHRVLTHGLRQRHVPTPHPHRPGCTTPSRSRGESCLATERDPAGGPPAVGRHRAPTKGHQPMKRPCLICGTVTDGSRCPAHRSRRNGSTRSWRALRDQILARDRWTCAYCGGRANTVDHLQPVSRGGSDQPSNLVAACGRCNRQKGDTPRSAHRGAELASPQHDPNTTPAPRGRHFGWPRAPNRDSRRAGNFARAACTAAPGGYAQDAGFPIADTPPAERERRREARRAECR